MKEFLYRFFGIKTAAEIEKDKIFHLRSRGIQIEGKSVFRCAGECGEYGEHLKVWLPDGRDALWAGVSRSTGISQRGYSAMCLDCAWKRVSK